MIHWTCPVEERSRDMRFKSILRTVFVMCDLVMYIKLVCFADENKCRRFVRLDSEKHLFHSQVQIHV